MKYRAVPHTDLIVSEVGVGVAGVVAPQGSVRDAVAAVRLLRQAYDHGVNYFDLSGGCAQGDGAARLAETFPPSMRDKVVIASGFSAESEGIDAWTIDGVRRALDGTLKQLQTDWVDVFQLRNPPADLVAGEELVDFLDRCREAGKIRAAGLILGCEDGWSAELRAAIDRLNVLLVQADGRVFSWAAHQPHSALAVRFSKTDELFAGGLENFKFLWEGTDRTAGQAAVQFLLSRPGVCTVLPDFSSESELAEFAQAPLAPALTEQELAVVA